ncbi:glycosyltransferase [Flavobacterium xanthum]|uniref:Glycosyl transferase 4-like n=1 Tax=Flavobacterium xanthum TaxID=69322 RepID=A0A1M7BGR8_9FLAO|nr:glycosyltransferase [Flavobacterium xanthum]SHL54123.1 Glycosyl transferase 4-like [Flavobacterium xanthum]
MKILFVSMHSIHAIRWIENLQDTTHELYWFDVTGNGKLNTLNKVHQLTNWKNRKIPNLKGEYFLRKNYSSLYNLLNPFLEVTANEYLEKIILEIQPDLIHSFEMHTCSYPILKTMIKFKHIKWLYSCWGNDLYFNRQIPKDLKTIKRMLARIDFLHTDCQRDFEIAKSLGFMGDFYGVIPTGGGYDLTYYKDYALSFEERRIILIKGYEHLFGRGLNVIKALQLANNLLLNYEVVVFGAHQEVIDFIDLNKLPYKTFGRHDLSQMELIKLMGKSILYIGNSISDGMPNTLLEAIIMQAFPIQSNPGNATAEIIENKKNGLVINDSNDVNEIKDKIVFALTNLKLLKRAMILNNEIAEQRLNYNHNQIRIEEIYSRIDNILNY